MISVNEILQIKVIPQYPRKVVISWDIGQELPYPLAFNIYRSGSSGGEFEKLNQFPFTEFFYEDLGLKPLSKLLQINYKLEIIFPTGESQLTNPISIVPRPRLKKAFFVARRMDQKYGIEYNSHTGIELKVFKRRHWGEKCTSCFNPVTESSTNSNCPDCLGTTFKKGFWEGIPTLGKIDPKVLTQNLDPNLSFVENINAQMSLRAFPLVKKGDVIVNVTSNVRWYVNTVQLTEHTLFPVKQTVEVREIERSSILYSLK